MNYLYHPRTKHQQGMTLIMAMVMLVVITGIGASAVKLSTTDTLASSNSALQMLVFQGAESTLIRTASPEDLFDIKDTVKGAVHNVLAANLPDESILGGKAVLTSTAAITILDTEICPFTEGFINSDDYSCTTYNKDVTSQALGAKANHIEGVSKISAKK